MRRFVITTCGIISLFVALLANSIAGDDAKESLNGVWIGVSMEVDGKALSADAAKKMQFTFKDDKLFLKGNFEDDRESVCDYKIDPKQSPKQLDFTPQDQKRTIQGIYEVKDGTLKVCMRHEGSSAGRPTEFVTRPGSMLVLVMFNKKKS